MLKTETKLTCDGDCGAEGSDLVAYTLTFTESESTDLDGGHHDVERSRTFCRECLARFAKATVDYQSLRARNCIVEALRQLGWNAIGGKDGLRSLKEWDADELRKLTASRLPREKSP